MTQPLSVRRRQLLRDEISRVAIELFAERGFESVTVDDIATAAGTSPRTFFRYFATKDDVVLDYERRLKARLVEALRSRPDDEHAVEALREAFKQTARVAPNDRPRVLQHARILRRSPGLRVRANGERFAEDAELTALTAERLGPHASDLHVRVIVTAMTAVAVQEFWAWVDGGGRGDPAERIAAALMLVEQGLDEMSPMRRKPK
jgi:AcrR family transcriptional regulator